MAMYNPPHPGEYIAEIYLEPNGISGRELALRLSKTIGRSPESWLAMQDAHDLWQVRQHVDLQRVGKLTLVAA